MSTGSPHADLAVELRDIEKRFPGVLACDRASLQVARGEVHAVVGENGAGKSTLLSILGGLYAPDSGQILLDGRAVRLRSPRDAAAHGIAMVHQHFSLIPKLGVVENILLGQARPWWLSRRVYAELAERLAQLSAQHGLPVDPRRRVADLSVAEQQRVEILKALYRDARIVILDEPTAVLSPAEADQLRQVLCSLRAAGRTLIYVSHKLDEVFALADRVTVLRQGRSVRMAVPVAETDRGTIAAEILGERSPDPAGAAGRPERSGAVHAAESPPDRPASPALRIVDLHAMGPLGSEALRGLSLQIAPGEIYGVAGVTGNGQRELCDVLCGLRPLRSGSVEMNGHSVASLSVSQRRKQGLAIIPEDRYAQGCAASLSVADNVLLTHSDRPDLVGRCGLLLSAKMIRAFVRRVLSPLHLSASIVAQDPPAGSLSGGTLQKLILARELAHRPTLLLAAYPCRGLDIGAMQTVHRLLFEARDQGCAILVMSEQLDELVALCDRIGALVRGRIVGEVALTWSAATTAAPLCTPPDAMTRLGRLISGLTAQDPRPEAH